MEQNLSNRERHTDHGRNDDYRDVAIPESEVGVEGEPEDDAEHTHPL